jgi:hypothetical protein
MTRSRRIAFVAGFVVLAVGTSAATIGLVRLMGDSRQPAAVAAAPAPSKGAVKAVRHTAVAATPSGKGVRQIVVGFLAALRDGDYARACDQLLDRRGCEDGLAATNAGVTAFRVTDSRIAGGQATVVAVADGLRARFTLLKRSERWWISALELH